MNEHILTPAKSSQAAERGRHAETSKTLGEQSKQVVADVQELGNIARDSAAQAVDDLRERGNAALQSGREHAVEARSKLENYIVEQPLKSLGIALGAGVVLGLILRR